MTTVRNQVFAIQNEEKLQKYQKSLISVSHKWEVKRVLFSMNHDSTWPIVTYTFANK